MNLVKYRMLLDKNIDEFGAENYLDITAKENFEEINDLFNEMVEFDYNAFASA